MPAQRVLPRRPASPSPVSRQNSSKNRSNAPQDAASTLPDLELDLSPIEVYIKALVTQQVKTALRGLGITGQHPAGNLREEVRALINEAIEDRLRGLFAR